MKRNFFFLFVVLSFASTSALAGKVSADSPEQQCYGISMVGYDSVINSRLGVTPDAVVHLAKLQHASAVGNSYAPFLLKVIMDAYFWSSSPHEYAVKTMYNCAQNDYRDGTAENLAKVNELID